MNAATLQQGRMLLSSLGYSDTEITRMQTQRAALRQPAVQTSASAEPTAPQKPEWVRTRPALKLDPLRERIAALMKPHFTHREVGEMDVHTVNILVREGELRKIRVGHGGHAGPLKLSPLYARTRKFWNRYRIIAQRRTEPTEACSV